MNTNDNVYSNTDEEYHEICEFLNRLSTKAPFMLWESGRMNFWRYNIHANKERDARFFKDNVHVWRSDTQEIVGICISEYGNNDLFIEVLPEYNGVYPDIFRWINHTWATTRAAIEVDVFSEDVQKIQKLGVQGFSFKCHFENKRTYDLEQSDLRYTLEEGFTIQAFSESLDFASRVALVQSAFDNPKYMESNLRGLMASPDYIDEYNLVVVAPDKQHVAYCIGWHEQTTEHRGYIEPVGTHAAYRRRGFAKAIIKECFARMKANGIHTVEIASRAEPAVSNYLYDSLAPQTKREVHKYVKKVSA
ncbi:MAG: GNAT family N-acetyltransferase [Anaerolineae bacterium]|nr:GNAT family N-acetyltransferase [Anaerolineae bacterium]